MATKSTNAAAKQRAARGRNDRELSRVVKRIEEDIVFGQLHPRERLVEGDLLARFTTTRYVIREAFAELERIGLITRVKNRGAIVVAYTPIEVENLYFMREALEREAVNLIAMPLKADTLFNIAAIQRRHTEEVKKGNLRAAFRIDAEFHKALFATCGNPLLSQAVNEYAHKAHAIRSSSVVESQFLERSRVEHEAMIDALDACDRPRLLELCRVHIIPSKEYYIAAYKRRFPTE